MYLLYQASTALHLKHGTAGCQIQKGECIVDQSQLQCKGWYGPPLQLMNSMEHNPSSEIDNHLDTEDIPHVLWNLKVHYCVDKSLPADTI
jgi:hypothetical protein